jgi:hypothetical protein
MPYRAADGFSWYTSDDAMRARRVAAALVLVAAGWATGFFAGRMSAWVFPVTETNTAVTAVLDKTPQHVAPNPPTAEQPAPRVENKQALAAKQPEPPAASAPPEQAQPPQPNVTVLNKSASQQSAPQAGDDKRITVAPDEGDSMQAPGNDARIAETNAERAPDRRANRQDGDRRVSAMDDGQGFDAVGIAECESRYSSFRRSDGTYQPYGRSSRQVCPFLR